MTKSVLYQGKEVFYQVSGEKYQAAGEHEVPSVVLIHGFAEDSQIWSGQISYLEKKFQLIVPDLPGSGKSGLLDDMSMEGMAGCLHSLLEKENISKCIMIGHSMGGYITLAFAEKYPRFLSGLGLFHSTAFADSAEKVEARKKGIKLIEEHGAFSFLNATVPGLYGSLTKDKHPELIEQHLEAVNYFTKEALTAYYQAMIERPGRIHILEDNKFPILFVLGKYDSVVPLQDGLKQSHLPCLSYIHILDRSGHMGMREEEEESNKLLAGYITSLQTEVHI